MQVTLCLNENMQCIAINNFGFISPLRSILPTGIYDHIDFYLLCMKRKPCAFCPDPKIEGFYCVTSLDNILDLLFLFQV